MAHNCPFTHNDVILADITGYDRLKSRYSKSWVRHCWARLAFADVDNPHWTIFQKWQLTSMTVGLTRLPWDQSIVMTFSFRLIVSGFRRRCSRCAPISQNGKFRDNWNAFLTGQVPLLVPNQHHQSTIGCIYTTSPSLTTCCKPGASARCSLYCRYFCAVTKTYFSRFYCLYFRYRVTFVLYRIVRSFQLFQPLLFLFMQLWYD